jgi:hypothetical protein
MDDKETLEAAIAAATLRVKFDQLRSEVDELWKWKKENEGVILWARNYMETYRRTMGTVLGAGAITIIGLLIQVYYTLSKSK